MAAQRIFAMRSGNTLTLIYKNRHFLLTDEMIDLDAVYAAANELKTCEECDVDVAMQVLDGLLDPLTRIEISEYVRRGLNGQVYLGKSEIPVGELLSKKIIEFVDEGLPINNLVNFWHLCQLNPSQTAIDGFFEYINEFNIVITDNGYVLLYKAVYDHPDNHKTESSESLAKFVATKYLQIKDWKKSPKNYDVYEFEGMYSLLNVAMDRNPNQVYVGNLADLYGYISGLSHKEGHHFTDMHTQTMKITLGEPVVMDRDKCDPNIKVDCSYGLHVGSFKYVRSFGRSERCTILACLVNPMDVVALPVYDHSKIRVCRYYPYAIMDRAKDGEWKEIETATFEEGFQAIEKAELEEMLRTLETSHEEGKAAVAKRQAIVSRLEVINQ